MAADATITVDSSTTDILKSLTPAQHKTWRTTGEIPESKSPPEAKDSKEVKQSTEAASSPAAKPEVAAPAAEKPAAEVPAKSAPAATEPTGKPKTEAEARIKDLLAENKKLNQELETLRKTPVVVPAKSEAPAKPLRNDLDEKGQPKYATDEAFEEAREKYLTEKVTRDVRQQVAKEAEQTRIAEQNKLIEQRMLNSIKIATEKHPDFAKVMESVETEKDGKKVLEFKNPAVKSIKANGVLDAWILDSEIGMELLYHLAQNPAEIDRIQSLGPFAAARELTKLEDKLSAPASASAKPEEKPASSTAPAKVSSAPAPAASVSGKGTAPLDEELAATEAGDFRRFQKAANEADWRKKKAS